MKSASECLSSPEASSPPQEETVSLDRSGRSPAVQLLERDAGPHTEADNDDSRIRARSREDGTTPTVTIDVIPSESSYPLVVVTQETASVRLLPERAMHRTPEVEPRSTDASPSSAEMPLPGPAPAAKGKPHVDLLHHEPFTRAAFALLCIASFVTSYLLAR